MPWINPLDLIIFKIEEMINDIYVHQWVENDFQLPDESIKRLELENKKSDWDLVKWQLLVEIETKDCNKDSLTFDSWSVSSLKEIISEIESFKKILSDKN